MDKQRRDKEEVRKIVRCLLQYYEGGEPEEILEIIKEEINRQENEECNAQERF